MSATLTRITELVAAGQTRISDHGYEELAADGIRVAEVIAGVSQAILVEDYPDYRKGPCCLVLERDSGGRAIHVLWGIPRRCAEPAVLVTAYRPDPLKWSADFLARR